MPFELLIGLRYLLTAKGDRFVSFVSVMSFLGIALGVAALIVVMSVMNGFHAEVRDRILSVEAHVTARPSGRGGISDWQGVRDRILALGDGRIEGIAPFISEQGLVSRRNVMQGAVVKGVLPQAERAVTGIGMDAMTGKSFEELESGSYELLLGERLAAQIGADIGDHVLLIAPRGRTTPAGIMPRVRRFDVAGTFKSGVYQYDSAFAYAHIDDIGRLYGYDDKAGSLQIRLVDLFEAPDVSALLNAAGIGEVHFSDWTRRHQSLFRALAVEKRVMFIILTLIIMVAAFNIVTALAMSVRNRRGDISILRTFGTHSRSIVLIFIVQGALIGIAGVAFGIAGGVAVAKNIDVIMNWVESALGLDLFPSDVYILDDLPSRIDWSDVGAVSVVAFVISMVATLYPSYRAAKVMPSEVLRHE